MLTRFITFIQEARTELKKVTWPTREEAIKYTASVIVISGGLALFLGGLDFVFQYILNKLVL